ncbi:type I restriction enzyme, S subunit [Fibrobacter sp. UWB16]|uniref:restriction endonuclease subunit S n=1 Tax=Fibrobacter sp. UWB16 TaxID=1945874 RepID=UPI000BD64C6D|nr:restriction endonuclease subunit S [Fibrobacter sp. UWB16]SOD17157.1 type I restriction enzyme, S subunit [Fibrobacter sp. UWB16]
MYQKKHNPHYEKIEDEPFEIPQNWVWCRLGNICDKLIDGDHNPPKGLNRTTEYIMLSSRNINDNDIVDLENVRYLSKDMFEEENLRTKLEKGDILFTSVGSLGRSCVFSGDGKYCFQRSVSVIHTNIYNKYLKYFFDSNYYQKYIVENATGTAQLGFYLEQMRKSFIAIPPLNEQSRIVAKIEELFSTLDQMERNLV